MVRVPQREWEKGRMPSLERRRLQLIGKSSFAAIVPPRAVRRMGLRAGDEVVVGEAGGLVVLGPLTAEGRILVLLAGVEGR